MNSQIQEFVCHFTKQHKEKGLFLRGPSSEAYPPSPDGEAERYGGDPPDGGSTIICPVGVRGYGGGSASRFSASFLIKFETYELG